jgi:hypothetical protein
MIIKNQNISTGTLVVFGSLRGEHVHFDNVNAYDFLNSLKNIWLRTIFVSDSSHTWYNNGIDGYDGFDDSIEKLEKLISGYTIFMGHSSGGYGAILYGCKLGVDRVIAFSPQLTDDDASWGRLGFEPKFDMRDVVKNAPNVNVQVVYCKGAHIDERHVNVIACEGNVQLIRLDCCAHNSARHFVKDGKLEKFILEGKYA